MASSITQRAEDNSYTQKIHYVSTNPTVAKLFVSNKDKEPYNEPIYKALSQCLNALIYFSGEWHSTTDSRDRVVLINNVSDFPIIIVNDFERFYKVDMEAPDKYEKIKENFQLEVNYAFLDKDKIPQQEYFLIDVVSLKTIDSYLKMIHANAEALAELSWG